VVEKLKTQVHTVTSNSRTSNCQCRLSSKIKPNIRIFCIYGWLAIPIHPSKWSVPYTFKTKLHHSTQYKFIFYYSTPPLFCTKKQPTKYKFYRSSKNVVPFYTRQILWQVAYPPLILVILEDGIICLHIIQDHQLNDQLYIT